MPNQRKLQKQVHKINELSRILEKLLVDVEFYDNDQCCRLFAKYVRQVKDHCKSVEQSLYSELLLSNDKKFSRIAGDFIQSAEHMKCSHKKFSKKWWDRPAKRFKLGKKQNKPSLNEHRLFVSDITLLFEISRQHLDREQRILYPAIKDMHGIMAAA